MISELYELPTLRVSGSPREMGRSQGEALRGQIQEFAEQRYAAVTGYLAERAGATGRPLVEEFAALGKACLAAALTWDPEGTEEHIGIAEGANIPSDQLYAVANMTDVRDVLLLPQETDGEGCTSLIVPAHLSKNSQVLAGQTWDLNPEDLSFVVAVHRLPASGPETWSVSCVGCLTLVGMNQHGLAVGTTNIKVRGSRPGIGYMSLLHRIIREDNLPAVGELIEGAPRAAAHTYWAANAGGGFEYEVSAQGFVRREAQLLGLARTNHCLAPEHRALQGEPTSSSSSARLDRMQQILSQGDHDLESIRRAFADRQDGVDSIARFPEDNQGTATNSCLIAIPETRELWACKGPSQRGRWVQLPFERG